MEAIYYESHITIEPVFDKELEFLKTLCIPTGFKVADLLMQKRSSATPERSQFDTFCTAKAKTYEDLKQRTLAFVEQLKGYGYKVWRYKIEAALLDERIKPNAT